jgi:lipocalin
MAADQIVYNTFENDAYCSTALYGLLDNGTISVHNYCTLGSPNGTVYTIDGYAYGTNPDEPGQLAVHFDAEEAAPYDAPYWVLSLGPLNANNLYDWAIVSDNLSYFLFVLARDVETFNTLYKEDVYAELEALGFTGRTAPIDTYQGTDCIYEASSSISQHPTSFPSQSPKSNSNSSKSLSQTAKNGIITGVSIAVGVMLLLTISYWVFHNSRKKKENVNNNTRQSELITSPLAGAP